MKTWLTEFSARFEEAVHRLLWQQWSLLGVAGSGLPQEARTVVDTESLLLFTLEGARTEPRLFDEVLDWLLIHGHWIDIQRLRNFTREEDSSTRLLAAVAAFAGEKDSTAKWKRLATPPDQTAKRLEPLFLLPGNTAVAQSGAINSLFARYGYRRPPIHTRGLTGPIPMRFGPCLRLRLRALFGIGIRAEALTYLLIRGSAHAKDVSRAIGYSLPGSLQALREMAASEVIHVRPKGREKHYWTHVIRWWSFLGIEDYPAPGRLVDTKFGRTLVPKGQTVDYDGGRMLPPPVAWANWRAYFRGLAMVLRFLRRPDLGRMTPYVRESELNQAFKRAALQLMAADAPFQPPPLEGRKPQEYGRLLLASIAGAASGSAPVPGTHLAVRHPK